MTAGDWDQRAVRRAFERAAFGFGERAVVATRVREEMLSRLSLLGFEPSTVVDLGCGPGGAALALIKRFRKARVLAVDSAANMLMQAKAQGSWWRPMPCIRADGLKLPFGNSTIDLVFSNLLAPFSSNLDAFFSEIRRLLTPRGYFTFSTVGPDTFRELRAVWAECGLMPPMPVFFDMHDVGDALMRAGFADPVMDVDRFTLTYPSLAALHEDLKGMGVTNPLADRPRGLLSPRKAERLIAAYDTRRTAEGRLPLSCEIVFGQAWCPGAEAPIRQKRGETVVPLQALRRRPKPV